MFPIISSFLRVFSCHEVVLNYLKFFLLHQSIWLWKLSFLAYWSIIFIDFQTLNQPGIPGLNPIWFSLVQSLSPVQFFLIPWIAAPGFPVRHQLLELAQTLVHWVGDAINQLVLCHLLLLPSIFSSIKVSSSMSQFFVSGGQSIGASVSASVLPRNIQDWFPLGLTGLISLLSKGLSRFFSNTTVQKHQFFGAQLSL